VSSHDDVIPADFASRLGELTERGEHWGFLHVHADVFQRPGVIGVRRREPESILVEEFFRIAPPAPDAVDRDDGLGWSDAYIRADDIPAEIERLRRDELLLSGRPLGIRWLDGAEAQAVRRDYFP